MNRLDATEEALAYKNELKSYLIDRRYDEMRKVGLDSDSIESLYTLHTAAVDDWRNWYPNFQESEDIQKDFYPELQSFKAREPWSIRNFTLSAVSTIRAHTAATLDQTRFIAEQNNTPIREAHFSELFEKARYQVGLALDDLLAHLKKKPK